VPQPTYTPLANVTLGTAATSVTFSSIPATYRDLILIITAQRTGTPVNVGMRFNGDSGSNYSSVYMTGTGSSSVSATVSSTNFQLDLYPYPPSSGFNNYIVQMMDYSATDKHKPILVRVNDAGNATEASAGRWASTAAVNSLALTLSNFNTGSTFSLYGVIA
jgi:hypothetical protein